ncbi:hypothetical protein ES703_120691 [subsurface metagenome]
MSKLDICPSYYSNGIDYSVRKLLHSVLQASGNGKHRSNTKTITRVYTHRVNIFNKTNGNFLILLIPYNFQLKLFPSQNRLFHQDLMNETCCQTPIHNGP